MKLFIHLVGGAAIAALLIGAALETDITAHYIQQERLEPQIESPQPDGRMKKVVYEKYIDRIVRVTVSNEVIYATNTIDTSNAVIKLEPMDDRRAH
jgi:hypothetical protein